MKGINANVNNPMWKGDRVGKIALHEWVRNHLTQPKYCEACNVKLSFDLACVTGIYNRELSNWQYLCRTCHMKSDGRLDLIHRSRPPWNKGKSGIYSEECKKRISESVKRYYKNKGKR
jgi:hypothetical protein